MVADLLDHESCEVLRAHAQRREIVVVPLLSPPVDRRRHLLEIYAPGETSPMRLMAEPAGPPTNAGFPLRLEPCAEGEPGYQDEQDDEPTLMRPGAVVRSRVATSPTTLSERHTRDLDPSETPDVPAADPYLGRLLASGKYRLDACVGSGGMGSVYRGHHRDLDLVVAVKVLHASFQANAAFSQRFQAEALTMSRIDHPSVTRVLDFGQERDGLLYLVMEFLDGIDLQSVLDREGRLPLERLVRIMMQVCAALGHVHRHGVIHRDVKPTNILLVAGHDDDEDVPTEVPKVCDFGIALASGSEGGRVAGTPHYMSPEQCMGAELDARSDVYACGVLLYELATGVLPFDGEPVDILARQIREAPAPPSTIMPDLDPLFEAIIMKALAKDPAERQQNMRQLRGELKELLAPVLLEAGEPSAPPSVGAGIIEASIPFEGFERIKSIRSPSAASAASAPPSSSGPSSGRMSRAPAGEVWLDGDGDGVSTFLTTLAGTVEQKPGYHDSIELIEQFARDPQPWLSTMAATIDLDRFKHQSETLQKAVSKLMASADATTLSPIIRTMRAILKEGPVESNPRAKFAGRVLRVLRDPPRLAPLVEAALGGTEEPSDALQHVFVETQNAGAEALVIGRQGHQRAGNPSARVRFVALMRDIGAGGLPVTRAALSDCIARGERTGPFVEDLLRSVPPVADEATGNVVAELLQGATPATTAAAIVALAHLWRERAHPLMLGALAAADEGVRIAAITGLRAMGGIDALVVRQADAILMGPQPATDELRVAVVASLPDALPAARAAAAELLVRAFTRASRTSTTSPAVIVALARSLLAAVPNAQALIQQQSDASSEGVRRHLSGLLRAVTNRTP
ncbi:MAG: serine/threonine protein kinase [Labilithrix sp.]|nr:serine/threonine protein kinase [Labilithrix sp.]